jgi:hypothetical protein
VTAPVTTWQTDEPCPVCGTGLHSTDDDTGNQIAQDCPLCGWSAAWQAALNLDLPNMQPAEG